MVKVILSTAPDEDRAAAIADALVAERLAACVSVVPGLRSTYRFKGALQRESEVLLVIKTASDRVDGLLARLKELHTYEVPEMLVLDVPRGWPPYLTWVVDETRPVDR